MAGPEAVAASGGVAGLLALQGGRPLVRHSTFHAALPALPTVSGLGRAVTCSHRPWRLPYVRQTSGARATAAAPGRRHLLIGMHAAKSCCPGPSRARAGAVPSSSWSVGQYLAMVSPAPQR